MGPWNLPSQNGGDVSFEVEEVMRSCGGAVQGVRELPLSLTDSAGEERSTLEAVVEEGGERIYHNRADSGFVYADDGSYSSGPERVDVSKGCRLVSSMAFPGRRRALIVGKLDSLPDENEPSKCDLSSSVINLARPSSNLFAGEIDCPQTSPPTIQWTKNVRVRMSSSNQPWSLPRAKWEQRVSSSISSEDDDSSEKRVLEGSISGWSFLTTESHSGDSDLFGDIAVRGCWCIHVLATCSSTNLARSTVRYYDPEGLLKSVAFREGSVEGTQLD